MGKMTLMTTIKDGSKMAIETNGWRRDVGVPRNKSSSNKNVYFIPQRNFFYFYSCTLNNVL